VTTKKANGRPAATAGDLAPHPKNPRTISPEALERLGRSMAAYGDLSGLVFNRRSGRLVGGHQRSRYLDPAATITILERLERPSPVGTVALGYVELDGERWAYREVDVDERTERAMNLAANAHGGRFDEFELAKALAELSAGGMEDLGLVGFGRADLEKLFAHVDVQAPDDFASLDANLPTDYQCPKCGYEWSGKEKPGV
jgi:hypothetical protein